MIVFKLLKEMNYFSLNVKHIVSSYSWHISNSLNNLNKAILFINFFSFWALSSFGNEIQT